jgi:TrmH family RNA methyltransferase
MNYQKITSINNKVIVETKKLKNKKYRDLSKQFIVEGYTLVCDLIEKEIQFEKVFTTNAFIEKNNIAEIINSVKNVYIVSNKIIDSLSLLNSSTGIIGVAKKIDYEKSFHGKTLLIDEIQDPGNFGTIIRTADAAGFEAIYCSKNTVDLYNPKVLRATMGSFANINIYEHKNLLEVIEDLKKRNYLIIGTSLKGKINYLDSVVDNEIAVIVGNEGAGISSEIEEKCDLLGKIPIFGQAESLNVSVATGIILYEISKKLSV